MSTSFFAGVSRMAATCLAALLALSIVTPTASAQALFQNGAPVIIGSRSVPRELDLCNNYGSPTNYSGGPYRIVEEDRIVTRHEGIDFCARAGTPVIAPVAGRIVWTQQDHPVRGSQIIILTNFRAKIGGNLGTRQIRVGLLHMVPLDGLRAGRASSPASLSDTFRRQTGRE